MSKLFLFFVFCFPIAVILWGLVMSGNWLINSTNTLVQSVHRQISHLSPPKHYMVKQTLLVWKTLFRPLSWNTLGRSFTFSDSYLPHHLQKRFILQNHYDNPMRYAWDWIWFKHIKYNSLITIVMIFTVSFYSELLAAILNRKSD